MTNTVPMRETPDHASARVITLDEAAGMLCCSYSTVLRLVTDGELRAFRVRGAWRTSTAACARTACSTYGLLHRSAR